jgi:serine/threonine protein kinase
MTYWQRIEALFLESVDLPAEEQVRFLEKSCAGDQALLIDVKSLIAADSGSGVVIEAAVQQEAELFFEMKTLVGERLGSYRVVREIGRGGMGAVYLATRTDDEYRNEVAIKVVKRGMDTVEVLTRFRYERQILANLAHPYIARLFDGGSTQDGVPFFVMEYIEGRPIHVFCQDNALDFQQRCKLFLCVLEAVAYAHRNLVVHRDLKPANILVTADGTPKLLSSLHAGLCKP